MAKLTANSSIISTQSKSGIEMVCPSPCKETEAATPIHGWDYPFLTFISRFEDVHLRPCLLLQLTCPSSNLSRENLASYPMFILLVGFKGKPKEKPPFVGGVPKKKAHPSVLLPNPTPPHFPMAPPPCCRSRRNSAASSSAGPSPSVRFGSFRDAFQVESQVRRGCQEPRLPTFPLKTQKPLIFRGTPPKKTDQQGKYRDPRGMPSFSGEKGQPKKDASSAWLRRRCNESC